MIDTNKSEFLNYMLDKEQQIMEQINRLKNKTSDLEFAEDGKLIGSYDEFNPYYLRAQESADVFNILTIPDEIKRAQQEKENLEKQKEDNKELLREAHRVLKEEKNALRLIEKEISEMPSKFVTADDSVLEQLGTELEAKRSLKEQTEKMIELLNRDINFFNSEILNSNEKIKENSLTILELRASQKALRERRKSPTAYMDELRIQEDLKEISDKEKELENLRVTIETVIKYDEDYLKTVKPNREKTIIESNSIAAEELAGGTPEVSTPVAIELPAVTSVENPILDTTPEVYGPPVAPFGPPVAPPTESGESVAPYITPEVYESPVAPTAESVAPDAYSKPEEIDYTGSTVTPYSPPGEPIIVDTLLSSRDIDWHIPGKKFDFLEKFHYLPSEEEMELNRDYNGDVTTLISHSKDRKNGFNQNRIVVKIKEIASNIVESLRGTKNKKFESREPYFKESFEEIYDPSLESGTPRFDDSFVDIPKAFEGR